MCQVLWWGHFTCEHPSIYLALFFILDNSEKYLYNEWMYYYSAVSYMLMQKGKIHTHAHAHTHPKLAVNEILTKKQIKNWVVIL